MSTQIRDLEERNLRYSKSLSQSDAYWSEIASSFQWHQKWDQVLSGDFKDLNIKWFDGAKLNITENCLDRHLPKRANQVAIHWEPNNPNDPAQKITYQQLYEKVNQFAHVLTENGVKKGDRVIFYMSMIPELLTGVLACARIGAIHSVVFGGFSAKALADRINDCEAGFVITNDEAYRGDKTIALKEITNEAAKQCTCIKKILTVKHTGKEVLMQEGRDIWINEALKNASKEFKAVSMHAEDPLFILYTSGSTGKPKGLQHTTAGYMVWASETFKQVFQVKENDVYWCTADIGWITGHSYITYGPLLNGATQVMFEGIPTYPDAGRFWDIVEKYKVTHFYTAPTAIRALEACDIGLVKRADLSSLKVLGSVGEPINEEAWNWYYKEIGNEKCPIVDTWWQTETGGIMISNLAGVTPHKPTHATLPLPGVFPVLLDSEAKEIKDNDKEGSLCISKPWPGMARTIYGDHERYRQTYFSTYEGYYFTGDGAKRDSHGDYRIIGRVDDVINVSGHRIGTAEIEDVIDENDLIVEAAVVGYPHEIKGQAIMAYVIALKEMNKDEVLLQINKDITEKIGPIAKLDKVVVTTGLPKTRSGKIMRRILRKIAAGEIDSLGDTSTLLNPEIVDSLIKESL